MTTLDHHARQRQQQAIEVLCSTELEPLVEMVISSPEPDVFEARAIDGSVRFRRVSEAGAWRYQTLGTNGRDPLADQDPTRFAPLAAETAVRWPDRTQNSYPLAFERIAQIFDHPCAPDLCVIHTAAHRPTSNRGEHGSLGVVQSRAPFILSGAGVTKQGLIDGHIRMVDVAPTILALLGATPGPGVGPTGVVTDGLLLARQDGQPQRQLLEESDPPEHVLAVLFDGANANVLYDFAARGQAPTIAALMANGTALAHGSIASLPTVTLANHTTLLTGAHPGHHGVLHNAWYDRSLSRQVVTESPATWQEATQWLFPGVETIHEALHRNQPDALSISVNEPADRGADYSTFELFRTGQTAKLAEGIPHPLTFSTAEFMGNDHYRFGAMADASALLQASSIWNGAYLGQSYGLPRFCWVSFSLTDSAMHEGGPHSEIAAAGIRDTDARLGALLEVIEARGVLDRTAIVMVADHGMEENDAELTGDWSDALRAAGIEHRDEASGFLYLGDVPDPAGPVDPLAGIELPGSA